ncbi:hypothetical protein EMIHUDRAFT_436918 [Emiliania huxleyi CCMP1516]|uniref:RNA helicase n=2 Tax=Emiliania huxleyi TaxID=2903 RepID=A0A0D3IT12_EMIH1|nr:hypothetical protein EMIHUDRAFT_436918 [Emiliania huxleyi CCMP1516]EOD14397.1 hypothetical protein EMIHUDRAFT_436918 [Emiliania huxleyi CCMP1516]|eukprot:XP_005766826.1 hypothetical protein EMIHUDRAFT_436918 [Emiliania huxleyi CCMP1516]
MRPQLLKYACVSPETNQFGVPPLEQLLQQRLTLCTCAATHMLLESGVPCASSLHGAGPHEPPAELLDADGAPLHYTHIIVDEASQALEPEMLLPLSFAGPRCDVLMCGDHRQLGPTVRSTYCREHGLATSMLERLMKLPLYAPPGDGASPPPPSSGPPCVTKLVRNYRSHAALLSLPSRLYYGSELQECADPATSRVMEGWEGLRRRGFPLLFYGVSSAHTHEVDSPSFFNPVEAEKVAELIERLLAASKADGTGITTNDVAVVTPYRKQVVKVRQLLRSLGLGAVRVGSVDDYQGQEETIIIISTVLASYGDRSSLGRLASPHSLMSSPQRFNVAITRARALLVVVGDPNALIDDPSWRELLRYAVENDSYRGCPHPLMMEGTEDEARLRTRWRSSPTTWRTRCWAAATRSPCSPPSRARRRTTARTMSRTTSPGASCCDPR